MGEVGFLVGLMALFVGCLGDSVLEVNLYRLVKKNRVTSGFLLQVMLGGYLCVSGSCILQLSCGI